MTKCILRIATITAILASLCTLNAKDIATATSAEKKQVADAVKACGITQKMSVFDDKSSYAIGTLGGPTFFKTISSLPPNSMLGGIDPSKRTEVNFKVVGGKGTPFVFGTRKACQYIFAFKASGADDKTIHKTMKVLGWLPAKGQFSYMYVYELAAGKQFISASGTVTDGAEVAFPDTIPVAAIRNVFKIDSGGNVVATLPPPSAKAAKILGVGAPTGKKGK